MNRIFKWDGIDVQYPSSISWGFKEISSGEDGRTLDGTMKKDIVATKRELSCSWVGLDDVAASKLLSSIKAKMFGVLSYPDAFTGVDETKTFFTGDAKADVVTMLSGKVIWNINFDFIEK